ncbi:MAG: hypothetical protein H6722_14860 [Sandaracinus sp.]|nr:hypothetical protein [Sandaracinus sp.]
MSTLLLDELFSMGSARFLPELLASQADKKLTSFAAKWRSDLRPWAREELVRYVDDGCDRPGHKGLVKRLFKAAEKERDHTLMAHFVVAFDRLVKHRTKQRRRFDWRANETWIEFQRVRAQKQPARYRRPASEWGPYKPTDGPTFSIYTRLYLQRRALRYLRQLGHRDPAAFVALATETLLLYRDEHLPDGHALMDARSLMLLLHHGAEALDRRGRELRLVGATKLEELPVAPLHRAAWSLPGSRAALLKIAAEANALVVRRFALTWLRQAHVLDGLTLAELRPLLASTDSDVQAFAASLLAKAKGLESLKVSEWLELLAIDNPVAMPHLVAQVERCVTPGRLSLDDCVALAASRAAPVAELGLRWARGKKVDASSVETVLQLRDAKVEQTRAEAVEWVLGFVRDEKLGQSIHLRELVDARHADVRARALEVLLDEPRFRRDLLTLWAALAESPYDDVRAFLVRHLDDVARGLPDADVRHVWATTLLAIHRGSRAKRNVLRSIAERLARRPEEASDLAPLLAIGLRGAREAERRGALVAIAKAAFASPDTREALTAAIPELKLFEGGAA